MNVQDHMEQDDHHRSDLSPTATKVGASIVDLAGSIDLLVKDGGAAAAADDCHDPAAVANYHPSYTSYPSNLHHPPKTEKSDP